MKVEKVQNSQHHRDMPFKDVIANWWERLHVILSKMGKHGRRENGEAQRRDLAQAGAKLGTQVPDEAQKCVRTGPGATPWSMWLELL